MSGNCQWTPFRIAINGPLTQNVSLLQVRPGRFARCQEKFLPPRSPVAQTSSFPWPKAFQTKFGVSFPTATEAAGAPEPAISP